MSIAHVFQALDPSANALPGVGLPEQNNGVCTVTHQLAGSPHMVINGDECKSALCNNALFSTECTGAGHYLNLYEILVPDKPSVDNSTGLIRSSSQFYADSIVRSGLSVSGLHTHWTGTMDAATGTPIQVTAIHHYSQGQMDPVDFTNRTVTAIQMLSLYLHNQSNSTTPTVSPSSSSSACNITDDTCTNLSKLFQVLDPNATALPDIGLPSQGNGVCTITHQMAGTPHMLINGDECKSILCNNALFSTECTASGHYLNLYEIMIDDIPSVDNSTGVIRSSSQFYADSISRSGLSVSGLHTHWTGTMDGATGSPMQMTAIHHYSQGNMDPGDFVNRTVSVIQTLKTTISSK